MPIKVVDHSIYIKNIQTRLPFKFGVVTMNEVPHCIVELNCRVDGQAVVGRAADHFPPRWLTKHLHQSLADEARATRQVVRQACEAATGLEDETVFGVWQRVYGAQREWGTAITHPPLLWGFGVTFVERALIDAYCRRTQQPFAEAVRSNSLGIRPGSVYPELEGTAPSTFLPEKPSRSIDVRHTVGHGAPLTESGKGPNDGLPVTLEDTTETYDIDKFKIKITGDVVDDVNWVRNVLQVLEGTCADYRITLDANEQYSSVGNLRDLLDRLRESDVSIDDHLLFVEQPFPRDVALDSRFAADLRRWTDRPPIIVDESDGRIDSCKTALEQGYAGTSHKNCKGVFKGILNACLLEYRRSVYPNRTYILSAEDLTTIGPISLQQDLAVIGTLGISHAERNGHHFFRGLEPFDSSVQDAICKAHADLYRPHPRGFATLDITSGSISLNSVVSAPFGYDVAFDMPFSHSKFDSPDDWHPPI